MSTTTRPLAVVTGASSGIGLELAKLCAQNGFDLVVAADRPLQTAFEQLRTYGTTIGGLEVDLAQPDGIA
ncbi:MAG TPA: SDR family NAD(P)-dependent oxidoreductase, partial [Steroidobacteraceae bacterium]|nr:SDR family NAD(P)-dependent oxidoreductase [Steroidobacteraceae bacterium]